MEEPILSIRGMSKSFPGVQALQAVDLEVEKGVVHALMGENGAGKSTLMKILYGLYRPDEGEITFKGALLKGVEALVRWRHPEFGLLGPAAFIPQAETSETLMSDLTLAILAEAVQEELDKQLALA